MNGFKQLNAKIKTKSADPFRARLQETSQTTSKSGDEFRKSIELDYKLQMTRTFNKEELSKYSKENLVNKILKEPLNPGKLENQMTRSYFQMSKDKCLVRRDLLHSAPVKRTLREPLVEFKQNSEILLGSKQKLNANSEEQGYYTFSSKNKTIWREKKPIYAKSMEVDKWLKAHKRRGVNTVDEVLSKKDSSGKAKLRSIRELKDLTVYEHVQERARQESEERKIAMRKNKSANEFNSVVARIKRFLYDIKAFDSVNSFNTFDKINLYEYESIKTR